MKAKAMGFLAKVLLVVFLPSCAVAPFTMVKTARSLGTGNMQMDLGASPAPYLSFTGGATDEVDVGASVELQLGLSFGAFAKYSLLSQPRGPSFALLGGVGMGVATLSSSSLYAGPVLSTRQKDVEFYIHPRYTYVRIDASRLSDDDTDELDQYNVSSDQPDTFDIKYVQTALGVNFWMNNSRAAINLAIKHIWGPGGDDAGSSSPSIGVLLLL